MACCGETFPPIQFIIGTTSNAPAANQAYYYNPVLYAQNYLVFRNSWGYLVPNIHYTEISSGGFYLTSPDQFQTGETFTIIFY